MTTHLSRLLEGRRKVLEFGSGTGQHASYFAEAFPHLSWQPTDVRNNLSGIEAWRRHTGLANQLPAMELDLLEFRGPYPDCDVIFVANLVHITPWPVTVALADHAARALPERGRLIVYGPFRYADRPLEPSNEAFVEWLKARSPEYDIRYRHELDRLLEMGGFRLVEDNAMPSNNRLLVWDKCPLNGKTPG